MQAPLHDDELDALLDARSANDPGDWTTRRAVWTCSAIARAMSSVGVPTAANTVRRWCALGLLTASKTSLRGHYRVKAEDLRVFLNGHDAPLAA